MPKPKKCEVGVFCIISACVKDGGLVKLPPGNSGKSPPGNSARLFGVQRLRVSRVAHTHTHGCNGQAASGDASISACGMAVAAKTGGGAINACKHCGVLESDAFDGNGLFDRLNACIRACRRAKAVFTAISEHPDSFRTEDIGNLVHSIELALKAIL